MGNAPSRIGMFTDSREQTYKNRIDIGFSEDYREWESLCPEKTDSVLVINGHPVMEDWEDPYMRMLASFATERLGRVLEVGFGLGISARYIQEHAVREHVIIEANKDVFNDACTFAGRADRKTTILFGFWQDVVSTLEPESFDGILFDTYPLSQEEIHRNHFPFFPEAFRLLKKGGVFTYYSDEIADFSDEHRLLLEKAGFRSIDKEVCRVEPPAGCLYWKSATILAPFITK